MSRSPSPQTLQEAAQALLEALTPESRQDFSRVQAQNLLVELNTGIGDYIRYKLGLGTNNLKLLLDCKTANPEEAVELVIYEAWKLARNSK